jgi:signal transduction histidine kinase
MNELLARLQDARTRERSFVADAGHELRTPIAVLRTELELARRDGRTREELVDAVEHAYAETERIADLTEALLLLARADDPSSASTRRDRVVVADVVSRAIEVVATAASARAVTIETDCADGLTVRGDAALLRRAVENVLENAVRHAPNGSEVSVEASMVGEKVRIEVADQGAGFPEEFLPHAFERFRRADDARARTDGGHGLGLAIVLAIMRAHGGVARAENRPGGGAVVTLALPVGDDTEATSTS